MNGKDNMNERDKLIKFQQNRNYRITNNWLIGFTEAEGSFICGKQPSFSSRRGSLLYK